MTRRILLLPLLLLLAATLWAQQPVNIQSDATINLDQLAGISLASPTSYGSAPTGAVLGVNAYITNTVSVNQAQVGGTNVVADPCQASAKTVLPINEATGITTTIITGTSSKHTYVCSILLLAGAAVNVNLLSGTGTNCGTTVHAGLIGGTTAATGANLAANGGFTLGNGSATVTSDNTAADNICYAASGTAQVSGVLTYVQQ